MRVCQFPAKPVKEKRIHLFSDLMSLYDKNSLDLESKAMQARKSMAAHPIVFETMKSWLWFRKYCSEITRMLEMISKDKAVLCIKVTKPSLLLLLSLRGKIAYKMRGHFYTCISLTSGGWWSSEMKQFTSERQG